MLCGALVLGAPRADAQAVSSSARVPTIPATASVTVGGVFEFVPAKPTLVQMERGRDDDERDDERNDERNDERDDEREDRRDDERALCRPGACYRGYITVRANQRWQAQVRLRPSARAGFVAVWITPAPQQAVPLSTAFVTIATGSGASPNAPVALQFAARKANGRGGSVPSGTQLSNALEFRVVALP